MKEVKTIKIFPNGVDLVVDGERTNCKSPCELWDALGWDIENDKNADECAGIVTRQLYCFGYIDLSALTDGKHSVFVEVAKQG